MRSILNVKWVSIRTPSYLTSSVFIWCYQGVCTSARMKRKKIAYYYETRLMPINHQTLFLLIYRVYDHHHEIGTMEDNLLKTQVWSPGAYNLIVKVKQMHTAKYGNREQLVKSDKWQFHRWLLETVFVGIHCSSRWSLWASPFNRASDWHSRPLGVQ